MVMNIYIGLGMRPEPILGIMPEADERFRKVRRRTDTCANGD
jgi:hypothetical protein